MSGPLTAEEQEAHLRRHPSRGLQRVTWIWAVLTLWVSVHVYTDWIGLLAPFGLAINVAWIYQVFGWMRAPYERKPTTRRRCLLAWAFCPVIGLSLAGLYLADVPLAARIKLDERALLAVVRAAERGHTVAPRGRVGTFRIGGGVVHDDAVLFPMGYRPIFTWYGLAYSRHGREPTAEAEDGARTTYDHIVGRWWRYVARD